MKMIDNLPLLISVFSLAVAIWIPVKIKWEQEYQSLLDTYMSIDYAIAYQGVIEFFSCDCKNDVNLIKEKYLEHFKKEISEKYGKIDKDNCLHFQRRLLSQFFFQVNECAQSFIIGKNRVMKDFTASEAELIKILIYMGIAIDTDEEGVLYKDISSSAFVPSSRHLKGQNKGLGELYHVLRKSKRFITVH